jgi:hypothetical protein
MPCNVMRVSLYSPQFYLPLNHFMDPHEISYGRCAIHVKYSDVLFILLE